MVTIARFSSLDPFSLRIYYSVLAVSFNVVAEDNIPCLDN